MKLVCAFLSLPVPSKSSNSCGDQVNSPISRSVPDYLEQKTLLKFLLVGYSGSGTSTIFKQAKILYKSVPFTEDERENIKLRIQSNVYGYIGILLEGREHFEEESLDQMKQDQGSGETDASDTCICCLLFSTFFLCACVTLLLTHILNEEMIYVHICECKQTHRNPTLCPHRNLFKLNMEM
uniref:Extra-large guanine nucleotide-binding protein 1 n=1 Tax=Rhizophora mucronata TaxID=61149 RepID=A0A2P2MD32_RHIMU